MRALPAALLLVSCYPETSIKLEAAPNNLPDVVLIMLDDINRSDLEAVPTPNIDAFRSSAMSFTRAYSMPTCSPTRITIHRGRWDRRFFSSSCRFLPGSNHPLAAPILDPDEFVTMPDVFKRAGYSTGLFGKWHTGIAPEGWLFTPTLNGYDNWRAGAPAQLAAMSGPRCNSNGFYDWQRVDDGVESFSNTYATTATVDATLDWAFSVGGPRFAHIAFHAPHTPLEARPIDLLPPGGVIPPDATPRQLFELMVQAIDTEFGRLVASIPPTAYVFFTADNGTYEGNPAPGVDPFKLKKTTFEGGINVPLLVRGPGVKRGVECHELVSLVDLYATFAELTGQSTAETANDSVSFLPLLLDPKAGAIRRIAYSGYIRDDGSVWDEAAFTLTHKLRRVDGVVETLYDLTTDPGETSPIVDEAIASPLRDFMDQALQ